MYLYRCDYIDHVLKHAIILIQCAHENAIMRLHEPLTHTIIYAYYAR